MAFLQSEPQARIELSPKEMLAISRAINREFAPRFAMPEIASARSMAFSPQELLAISQEISREFAPRSAENHAGLVLMPVDPLRLHVYWQLPEYRVYASPDKPVKNENLTLRIFKQSIEPFTDQATTPMEPAWFDVAIDSSQNNREVVLPVERFNECPVYRAVIGTQTSDQDFEALLYSNTADIPTLPVPKNRETLPPAVSKFIMPAVNASSPIGKALSP